MKIPVLKALANPARIFYVPYNLAVFNFIVWFFIYIVIFTSGLVFLGEKGAINPLYFMLVLIATHLMLAVWSKREPFILKILLAKISLFRKKIPDRLAV